MNALIVGGTSGLGLELAKCMRAHYSEVYVTGRKDFCHEGLRYKKLDLSQPLLVDRIKDLLLVLPTISTFVYAAGYYQEARVTELSERQIEEMIDIGGRGLIYFIQSILNKQNKLDVFISITSTSQWIPRKLEPIYNFVKAGAANFSNAIAEDGRVTKVLVAAPAGMNTPFWSGVNRDDLDTMLDPAWVANAVLKLVEDNYKYRFAKIMRGPARVEIVETR